MSDKNIIRLNANPQGFGTTPDVLDEATFTAGTPVQHTHIYFTDEKLGLHVGVWDTTAMTETGGAYLCDEFMWLLEGQVEIRNNKTGELQKAKAGEAFVIPKGYDCQWQQTDYLRKFFMISDHPNETIPANPAVEGIIVLPTTADMDIVNSYEPFSMIGEDPVQKNYTCYQDSTGQFIAGLWESTPFKTQMLPFPCNEFIVLLEGTITLTDQENLEHQFVEGDVFFVPEGTVCSWHSTQFVRKFYASQQSKHA